MILSLEQNDSASGLVPFIEGAIAAPHALLNDRDGNSQFKAAPSDKHRSTTHFVFSGLIQKDGPVRFHTHRLVSLPRATAKHGASSEKVNALRGLTS